VFRELAETGGSCLNSTHTLAERGHASAGLQVRPCDLGKLQRFDTLEQDGLVFVFMGGDSKRARRPAFRVPYWGDPKWTVYFMVTRFPNGVTNLVENFMDVPHTVFVHEGWFRRVAKKRVPATVKRSEGSVLVTYKQEQDTVTGLGRIFSTETDLLHADIEAYRSWLREGGHGPGPSDEERDIVFWI
jgi:phenylpropionate dioxygenase-like ring-hydroxylating dioxygenase large terminal subunit